jgi:succinate dehydrogenase / fumarate reductase, cytochrome b subunit
VCGSGGPQVNENVDEEAGMPTAPALSKGGVTSETEPFLTTTVGKKLVMAVTGVILFGFVIVHMLGNLQVYLGAEAINAYGLSLHTLLHGAGIWVFRSVLLVSVLLHIWAMTALTLANRRARDVGYRRWKARESTYASRTMRWSGVFLLAFIIFHLLHFTTGDLHPDFIPGDVYHNVVTGFQAVPVAILYILATLALALHLFHGAWSMLQTLGLNHPRYNRLRNTVSVGLAALVVIGNLSFPVAVLAGLLH